MDDSRPVLHPVGLSACLVQVPAAHVTDLYRHLTGNRPAHASDIVPAETTVLVDGADCATVADTLTRWRPRPTPATTARPLVRIPAVYDGPDLPAVAAAAGVDPAQVVAWHTGVTLTAAFCGFAPGFTYLTGLPAPLHLPRLPTPRPAVPAGSVALAAGYTAVYPRRGPGGWLLIGRAAGVRLFDVDRDPPALLPPGTRVRFTAVPA
ncbi:MAG TPA: carboxyltransferase domain-containing protein [Pilimelia sp.]|nr:carboxyltransferase domain-containing protein [Pilimelia sp.]